MSEKNAKIQALLAMGLQALLFWGFAAAFSLLILSFIIWRSALPSQFLAYGSALISFIAAAAAGWSIAKRRGRRLLVALACAAYLSICLLIIGYLISGKLSSHDGAMSVLSFTAAGALAGSMLAPHPTASSKPRHSTKWRHPKRKLT